MSIFVALHHVTHYKYDRPIDLGPQTVRLRPAPHTPHADPELFAQGRAGQPFRQLAAGPAGQLAGALVFPGEGHRAEDRGRSRRRDDRDQPVRLLRRALCRQVSVRLHRRSQDRTGALSGDHRAAGPLLAAYLAEHSARRPPARSISWSISTRKLQNNIRYVIRMEPGVQTPEETLGSAPARAATPPGCWSRSLRHLGLAARFVSGYLIQLRPTSIRSTGRAGRERLHRSARLGRGLSARRRLDRLRPHLGPAGGRGPHPARLHAALSHGGADLAARSALRRGRIRASR